MVLLILIRLNHNSGIIVDYFNNIRRRPIHIWRNRNKVGPLTSVGLWHMSHLCPHILKRWSVCIKHLLKSIKIFLFFVFKAQLIRCSRDKYYKITTSLNDQLIHGHCLRPCLFFFQILKTYQPARTKSTHRIKKLTPIDKSWNLFLQ